MVQSSTHGRIHDFLYTLRDHQNWDHQHHLMALSICYSITQIQDGMKIRNILLSQQKHISWLSSLRYARDDYNEWQDTVKQVQEQESSQPNTHQGPRQMDTNKETRSKSGWILSNTHGEFYNAAQTQGDRVQTPFESELQALLLHMHQCRDKGYRKVIFERDCQRVVTAVTRKSLHFKAHNWNRDIRWWAMMKPSSHGQQNIRTKRCRYIGEVTFTRWNHI
ncbi:unnamed protein product [Thlaspi arvense]|uniref:RNase H type-1 domain-containing protein n=1 Tax=Thlaspi arvense TaxID=13288 RepID=A0AAU9SIG8_THLAR|nr:unnamed protein product [Thlaspi arvense]